MNKSHEDKTFVVVQNVIASHESNGLDIIIALLLSDINPLRKQRIDLVLQLKVSSCIQCTCRSDVCPCEFGVWPRIHLVQGCGNFCAEGRT